MRAQTPRMRKTLKMFDPTILPMATSLLPAAAESTETTSSGVEVPTATMVSPTMNSGTRKRWARAAEPSVRKLAPPRMSASPRMSRKISMLRKGIFQGLCAAPAQPSKSRLTAITAMPVTTP